MTVAGKLPLLAAALLHASILCGGLPAAPQAAGLALDFPTSAPQRHSRRLAADTTNQLSPVSSSNGMVLQPNSTADGSGCLAFFDRAPTGVPVAEVAVQPTVGGCCQACRAAQACNVFAWCTLKGGCKTGNIFNDVASIPFQGCLLLYQGLSEPRTGRLALVINAQGLQGGAPITANATPIKGYDLHLGEGFFNRFDYPCNDSIAPNICMLRGSAQELAKRCDSDPACRAMVFIPSGWDYQPPNLTCFKGNVDLTDTTLNQNVATYVKLAPALVTQTDLEGSGLSGGAIAGIVVAACALLAVAGAGVGILWRKRRLREMEADLDKRSSGDLTAKTASTLRDSAHGVQASGATACAAAAAGPAMECAAAAAANAAPATAYTAADAAAATSGGAAGLAGHSRVMPWVADAASKVPPNSRSSLSGQGSNGRQLPASPTCGSRPLSPRLRGTQAPVAGSRRSSDASSMLLGADGGLWPGELLATSDAVGIAGAAARQRSTSASWEERVEALLEGSEPFGEGASEPASSSALSSQHSAELLSRLPEVPWQDWLVDISSIEFCTNEDGSYKELGSGGFGTVYKVLLDGVQPYAAKVVSLGDDPDIKNSFLKEASILRRLRHRNIVGFRGVCVSEGRGILIMELMEGGDLGAKITLVNRATGERPFSWHHRGKRVALDVARGIHYLHSLNLTHFDIKGNNILLTRDGTAKIADVGFTRPMLNTHHSIRDGRTGTFAYMAPELLMARPCTESVDCFSFGILLWEICSGERPQRGRCQPLQPPQDCPQEVADLYELCTAEEPSERPSARQLVETLTNLVAPPGAVDRR